MTTIFRPRKIQSLPLPAMDRKRLNLDAPLLSVRRSAPPPTKSAKPPNPFHRPESKSSPVCVPGVVPFVWESTPGQRKDKTATAGDGLDTRAISGDGDEALSDALSSNRSLHDCSSPDAAADPAVRSVTMGRFLSAAQARRLPPIVPVRPLLPHRCKPSSVVVLQQYAREREEEVSSSCNVEGDGEDRGGAGHLRLKVCRRISQFWMNLASGMKFCSCPPTSPGRKLLPDIKTLRYRYLGHANSENSWEAVYRYRLAREDRSQGEERSRWTSESNRPTYWSDSLTREGSSSFQHSDTTGQMDFADEDSEDVVERRRMEHGLLFDFCETNAVRNKFPEAVDPKLSCENPVFKYMDGDEGGKQDACDNSLSLKVEDPTQSEASLLLSLLPPPLPKSPSESWLSHAVSLKNQHPQSLIGIQFQLRRPSFRETNVKPSKMNYHLVKFTEVTM